MRVIASSLLLLAIGVTYAASQACHMREMDLCMATGMLHYQSNGIPDDDEKVTEWCDVVVEVRSCGSNYSEKCMSPLQREFIGLFAGGASDAERQLCTPGSELRNQFLKHSECLAEGAETDAFKGHIRDIQVTIETIFDVPFKKRMPLLCCGYLRFREGVEEDTRAKCGDDAVDMLKFVLDMIVTELPETICQAFDPKSDSCNDLPPSGTQPKGSQSKSQIAKMMDTLFGSL